MIQPIINYIWLSSDEKPELIRRCIASWATIMPEYEVRCWSSVDFDIESLPLFARQAYVLKKWAFVSDYLRLKILHENGGIYFDSDVLSIRPLTPLLGYDMFTAVEFNPIEFEKNDSASMLLGNGSRKSEYSHISVPGIGIQAAVMGAVAKHSYLRACLDFYEDHSFVLEDGSLLQDPIAPGIYAEKAEAFGFKWTNRLQILSHGLVVLPAECFPSAKGQYGLDSFAFHCCAGSWRDL